MSANKLKVIGLAVFVLILLFCFVSHPERIETDLSVTATDRLNERDFSGLGLAFDGRDATLTGRVASENLIQSAAATLRAVDGVRVVHNNLTVDIPIPSPSVVILPAVPSIPVPPTPEPPPVIVPIQKQAVQAELDKLLLGQRIAFRYNRMALRSSSRALLDEVVDALKNATVYRVEIAGYTDTSGSRASNLTLSQRRAEVVLDYLVAGGIKPEHLVARGYGEAHPVADNDSTEGRRLNRRVEFKVLEDEQ